MAPRAWAAATWTFCSRCARSPRRRTGRRPRALDAALDDEFEQIDGSGTLLVSRAQVLSDLERHDLGWFVACLCTPLLGEDLAGHLPRYRPDSLLARETNGDLALCLPRWRRLIAEATAPGAPAGAVRARVRGISRRLVRTGFTLVMPRWDGWTSDLYEMAEAFAAYYPEWGPRMREAAITGPRADGRPGRPAVLPALARRGAGPVARRGVRARARRQGTQARAEGPGRP